MLPWCRFPASSGDQAGQQFPDSGPARQNDGPSVNAPIRPEGNHRKVRAMVRITNRKLCRHRSEREDEREIDSNRFSKNPDCIQNKRFSRVAPDGRQAGPPRQARREGFLLQVAARKMNVEPFHIRPRLRRGCWRCSSSSILSAGGDCNKASNSWRLAKACEILRRLCSDILPVRSKRSRDPRETPDRRASVRRVHCRCRRSARTLPAISMATWEEVLDDNSGESNMPSLYPETNGLTHQI